MRLCCIDLESSTEVEIVLVELAVSKQRHLGIMYNCISRVDKNGVGVEQTCAHVFSSTQSISILSVSAECSVQCSELLDKKMVGDQFW